MLINFPTWTMSLLSNKIGISTNHKFLQLPGNKLASRFTLPSLQWQGVILLFAFSKKLLLEYNVSAVILVCMVLYNGWVTYHPVLSRWPSLLKKSCKSWTINLCKQLCIWFNRNKTIVCSIKSVIKQQQGEAIGTQGDDKILPEKDVHCFPAIYRISACIFTPAPPPLETQVSPTLIVVHTISPWIFFHGFAVDGWECTHSHSSSFSLFLPRCALPWLFWLLVYVGTLSPLQGMAPTYGAVVPHSAGWTSLTAASPNLLGTACTQAIRRIFFPKTQL